MADIDGRWRIVGSLGEGGQAHTFHVQDLTDGSEGWVLKRLKNRNRLERFRREIEALQKITSNYIPAVRAFSIDEPAYVVTPYLGPDLTRHGRVPELDAAAVLDIFSQVVTAIRDAHAASVVHRDIKPNNIVLSVQGLHAHVIDFGICQYEAGQLRTLTTDEALGNAGFAAPECFLGSDQEPTTACDVYSLGKVLFWLASRGGFIHRERVTEDVVSRIATDEPVVRECIARIVRHCVLEEPTQRPPITAVLQEVQEARVIVARTQLETSQGRAVLVDRFGSNGNFGVDSSRSATTSPQGNPPGKHELAVSFIPFTRVQLTSLDLGLGSLLARQQTAKVRLVSDTEGVPNDSDILDEFAVPVSREPHVVSLRSEREPLLREGERYWVWLSVDEPDSRVNWWTAPIEFRPQRETFARRTDDGSWQVATSPSGPGFALRVVGRRIG